MTLNADRKRNCRSFWQAARYDGKSLFTEFKGIPLIYSIQRKLRTRQFIRGLFIVRLHSRQIVVRVGVVDNVRLPAVLLFNALFGQPAFHFKQLALPLGQLRNIDQHLVDRNPEAIHDLRRVEAVDGVLKSADRSLQFFKTRLCFCA